MRATARSAYDELLPKHGLAVTFATAVLVVGGIFYGLVYLLDFQEIDTAAKLFVGGQREPLTNDFDRLSLDFDRRCFRRVLSQVGRLNCSAAAGAGAAHPWSA
ncbi:hypothetical protein [Streptomyces ardesiacus]|uniref:hypothetical protein n=1 Tax=Streptomyces ardesiacus TaxID=285564 RepID=UPI00201F9578|nr:hypothetical protein [Streptomyces ardesiacus]MCL7370499.1 hypothetical protein [Streptomyces ardesiacus]